MNIDVKYVHTYVKSITQNEYGVSFCSPLHMFLVAGLGEGGEGEEDIHVLPQASRSTKLRHI